MATETENIKAVVEADFDPSETARERLARLEAESKVAILEARKEAREEAKVESAQEFEKIVEPALAEIQKILENVEEATGKIFRNFSYYYKLPKGAIAPDIKSKQALVTPRGESTD